MRHVSLPMTLDISGASTYPYALPAAGNKILLTHGSVNYLNTIKPAVHDTSSWLYANLQTYGGGCFCPGFSASGAFVMAGQGGHGATGLYGASIFDFQTGTWSYRANSNGFTERMGDVLGTELTGNPDYEITGYGQMPAPAHMYGNAIGLPKSITGGNKGKYIALMGAAVAMENWSVYRAHSIDLETGLWTRASTNNARTTFPSIGEAVTDTHGAYDPGANRIYSSLGAVDYNIEMLLYLDCNDWTFKRIPCSLSNLPGDVNVGYGSLFVDNARRLLISSSLKPADWGGGATGLLRFFAVDLTNIAAGWKPLSVTDTTGVSQYAFQARFSQYPVADGGDGAWYALKGRKADVTTDTPVDPAQPTTHPKADIQALFKLMPPASNPLVNAWTLSLHPISSGDNSGGINAYWVQDTQSGAGHNGRFIYVPALRCFAWFPRGDSKVELIKP